MQAQGILLTMLGDAGTSKMRQDIQANDHAFGDIMTNLSGRKDLLGKGEADNRLKPGRPDIKQSQKLSLLKPAEQPESISEPVIEPESTDFMSDDMNIAEPIIDLAEDLVRDILKDIFGLSEDDEKLELLEDIMEQMGIQMIDLLLPFNQEILSFEGVDMNQIKNLLLEFHGIEDETLILTNPQLEQELNALAEGMENVLEQLKELPVIPKSDETLPQTVGITEKNIQDTVSENLPADTQTDTNLFVEVETSDANEENLQQDNKETGDGFSQKTEKQTSAPATRKIESSQSQIPADTFTAKLNNAVNQAVKGTSQISGSQANIIGQVIHHIRVRLMPETTSMELALNPESLGRVNIAVSVTNGVTTASMTVSNQTAKEVLESQLIALKETFAEKGMKVDSVEVTVSNFGFKNEGGRQEERNRAKQSTGKKVRLDSTDFEETDSMSEEELFKTEESRIEDSVVDYIA